LCTQFQITPTLPSPHGPICAGVPGLLALSVK